MWVRYACSVCVCVCVCVCKVMFSPDKPKAEKKHSGGDSGVRALWVRGFGCSVCHVCVCVCVCWVQQFFAPMSRVRQPCICGVDGAAWQKGPTSD